MRVERVDAGDADDALLRQLHRVEAEAGERRSLEDFVASFRNPGTTRRSWWAAADGDDVVGSAYLTRYGADLALANVLVRPDARRRRAGTALFEALLDEAREEGLASFFGRHTTPEGAAFARHVGARDDHREVKSVLLLREEELPAPSVPDGVALRSWTGPAPDELVESFVAARSAMRDAPAPGGGELPGWTVEEQRADERRGEGRGRPPRVTVALDGGDVLALTFVSVGRAPCPVVITDDTATVPAARGRGLALAVKLENLRRLRAERPDVEEVVTLNAEHNAAMRAINAKLGFVPVELITTAVVTP